MTTRTNVDFHGVHTDPAISVYTDHGETRSNWITLEFEGSQVTLFFDNARAQRFFMRNIVAAFTTKLNEHLERQVEIETA